MPLFLACKKMINIIPGTGKHTTGCLAIMRGTNMEANSRVIILDKDEVINYYNTGFFISTAILIFNYFCIL